MIKNERQYNLTRAQAERFAVALKRTDEEPLPSDLHPALRRAEIEGLRSQLQDLRSQIAEYEALQRGQFDPSELGRVIELPSALIKARIAKGMSQKQLAERLGLIEQQIQRYEATDYASASLARIQDVVAALDSGR